MLRLRITARSAADQIVHLGLSLSDHSGQRLAEAISSPQLSIPQSILSDVQWYLEDFLDDGSRAASARALGVRKALWTAGTDLFRAVFLASRQTSELWTIALPNLKAMSIEVEAQSANVSRIPWELLRDPTTRLPICLSSLSFVRSSAAQPSNARNRRVVRQCRVLLIISRPDHERDVAFRSVASKIFNALRDNSAFEVTVSPPPFPHAPKLYATRACLGSPSTSSTLMVTVSTARTFEGAGFQTTGYVVFEDEHEPKGRSISGTHFGGLLAEVGTFALILNACQSAFSSDSEGGTPAEGYADSFADDALRAGVPFLIAMKYNLYVSTAQRFMDEFYRQVGRGQTLSVAGALARKLLHADGRVSGSDTSEIDAWLVPLIFQSGGDSAIEVDASCDGQSASEFIMFRARLCPPTQTSALLDLTTRSSQLIGPSIRTALCCCMVSRAPARLQLPWNSGDGMGSQQVPGTRSCSPRRETRGILTRRFRLRCQSFDNGPRMLSMRMSVTTHERSWRSTRLQPTLSYGFGTAWKSSKDSPQPRRRPLFRFSEIALNWE